MTTRTAGASGIVENYPGGPRQLARDIGLRPPPATGALSYGAIVDLAVEAYWAAKATRTEAAA